MDDQNQQSINQTPGIKKKSNRALIILLVITIFLLILAAFVIYRASYRSKDPVQKINYISQQLLKPEYRTQKITYLKHLDEETKTISYLSAWKKDGVDFEIRFIDGMNGEEQAYFSIAEIQNRTDNSLNTVIDYFNKYFNMPNVPESAWIKKPYRRGFTYEMVVKNPDGTYNARAAYALPYDKNPKSFVFKLLACHITPRYHLFPEYSCIRVH